MPVVYILKFHHLKRGAGNDEPVVVLAAYLLEGLVELLDMLARSVARHMASGVDKVELHLQGSIGDKPEQVGLGHYFQRHQIEYAYPQRAYVLPFGTLFVDYEYVFPP